MQHGIVWPERLSESWRGSGCAGRRLAAELLDNAAPVLIVSPHPRDGAALSCAAVIARADRATVLTASQASPRHRNKAFGISIAASGPQQRAPRRDEQEEAATFAETTPVVVELPLLEWKYLPGASEAERRQRDRRAVAAWIDSNGDGLIVLPAGAGKPRTQVRTRVEAVSGERRGPMAHPDHLFVREAGLDAVSTRRDVTVILYEELPYLRGRRAAAPTQGWRGAENSAHMLQDEDSARDNA